MGDEGVRIIGNEASTCVAISSAVTRATGWYVLSLIAHVAGGFVLYSRHAL